MNRICKNIKDIKIYVDGSYNIYTKFSGWSWVALDDNDNIIHEKYGKTSGPSLSRQIDGELEAVMDSIKWCIVNNKFPTIYYDYIGIEKWALNEWNAIKQVSIQYKEFLKTIDIPLKFVKVKGHSKNRWNDYADMLAKKGVGVL